MSNSCDVETESGTKDGKYENSNDSNNIELATANTAENTPKKDKYPQTTIGNEMSEKNNENCENKVETNNGDVNGTNEIKGDQDVKYKKESLLTSTSNKSIQCSPTVENSDNTNKPTNNAGLSEGSVLEQKSNTWGEGPSEGFKQRTRNFFLTVWKTDVHFFMAYTATTVVTSFVLGSLFSGLFNTWYQTGQEERILQSLLEKVNSNVNTNATQTITPLSEQKLRDICQIERNETLKLIDENEKSWKKELNATRADIERNYSNFADTILYKQHAVQGQISALYSYFLTNVWSSIIVLIGLGEIFLFAVMCKLLTSRIRPHNQAVYREDAADVMDNNTLSRASSRNEIRGDENTLSKVHREKLNREVCTITFHSEMSEQHVKQTSEVLVSDPAIKTVNMLLNRFEDILRVPRSKVYIVYVDYNERNVILEDPAKGPGNIRLTTVQALSKMGGDVILVYARDVGSRNLPPDKLFNEKLISIKEHSELLDLSSRGRMFTIFKEFSNPQKEKMRDIILKYLKT